MIVIPRTSAILYVSSNSFSVMQMMWLLCKGLEPSLFFFIFHLQGVVWWQMCRASPSPRATWPPRCCGPLICTHSSRTRCVASVFACACDWVFLRVHKSMIVIIKKREKTWMFRTCVAGVYKTCHTTDAGILLGLGSVSYWRLHFVFISSAQGIFFQFILTPIY